MTLPPPYQRSSRPLPTRFAARWVCRPGAPDAAAQLARAVGIPPLLAKILRARGIDDPDEAARFLNPTLGQTWLPERLTGVPEAVERIARAVAAREKIVIYGDYDVDGATATTLLLETLTWLGHEAVDYYIPHRLNEGYGLNREAVEQLAAEGARLLITVDCGVTAFEPVRRAAELGVDVIVTDHHEPGERLPPAVAVIDPKRPDCSYPNKALSGAGVAFKLAHALLRRLRPDSAEAREFLKSLLDLVALGTVADIMPLTGENRALVAYGLTRLREGGRTGLTELFRTAQLDPLRMDAGDISFIIAPRLNAAGRTEHAMFAVELLRAADSEQARRLARQLEDFNRSRRDIEQAMLDEALELLEWDPDDRVLVVAQDGWHSGVVGIVASRLQGLFYRPAIVIGIDGDCGKGSGRSIPDFDLHEALVCCSEHLVQFGGHKMAAGLTIRAANIDAFRRAINAHAQRTLTADALRPRIEIDALAQPDDLTEEAVAALGMLAPFGVDNPKPLVALEACALVEPPRVLRERHLRLTVACPDGRTLTALGWGMAGRLAEIPMQGPRLDLVGTPILNAWNGRTSVELELKDFRAAG